jgi:hypothetical protein
MDVEQFFRTRFCKGSHSEKTERPVTENPFIENNSGFEWQARIDGHRAVDAPVLSMVEQAKIVREGRYGAEKRLTPAACQCSVEDASENIEFRLFDYMTFGQKAKAG